MKGDEAGSHRLRRGRISAPGRAYHVVAVCADRQPLLTDLRAGRAVVAALRHAEESDRARTMALVVMPDHLHWLMILGDGAHLSRTVAGVKAASARRINEIRGTAGGQIWQRGFFDRAVRLDEDLRATGRYIVANPARAGIVATSAGIPSGTRCACDDADRSGPRIRASRRSYKVWQASGNPPNHETFRSTCRSGASRDGVPDGRYWARGNAPCGAPARVWQGWTHRCGAANLKA